MSFKYNVFFYSLLGFDFGQFGLPFWPCSQAGIVCRIVWHADTACQCCSVCLGAMLPVYVQQQPAGTVWYNDGVVATERANRVTWHDRCTQAWVGTNCGFQQLREVVLCDVDARMLEAPRVPVTALPLLEKHLPVRVSKNPCLVLLLDTLPYVQPTDVSALAFWEH